MFYDTCVYVKNFPVFHRNIASIKSTIYCRLYFSRPSIQPESIVEATLACVVNYLITKPTCELDFNIIVADKFLLNLIRQINLYEFIFFFDPNHMVISLFLVVCQCWLKCLLSILLWNYHLIHGLAFCFLSIFIPQLSRQYMIIHW